MSTSTKSTSANYMASRYSITDKTARLFMHKVREAMKSQEQYPMNGEVNVDEFVIGGKEETKVGRSNDSKKKKVVGAVELSEAGKVKRFYAKSIDNYSSKELRKVFDAHISKDADILTDKWKGYIPLMAEYKIEQEESNGGVNFLALHNVIHQVKSWIRTTFSWVSEKHIERYLNEFSYRLNRSVFKETIFNNIICRMVKADRIYHEQIVCS